ncbi:MAG TPA: prepilin-type N-terminal cleavage/methylation domain-containing protein [Burkholderiales bacterium]|nr:prepilin-type N-terminal cleavage/methylation domain-containing protein [Burkholderiales bacterium]
MRQQDGFTLIEIAIVLVIIGLLLGGILKGQELITSARVRNLISQQDGVKAAYFGFLDRYRALPGDYNQASTNITGVAAGANGNNNGQITANGVAGATIDEHIAAWDHLSKAGFINGSYTYAAAPETTASAPTNPYARFLRLIYDNVYGAGGGAARHNLKTGNQIPSDILAEVDRKIDDGVATGGAFQFSTYDGGGTGGTAPTGSGSCYAAAAPNNWVSANPVTNCGGASLF